MDLVTLGTTFTGIVGPLAADAFGVLAIVLGAIFIPLLGYRGIKYAYGKFSGMGK